MSFDDFASVMRKAKPKQRILYHTGNLIEDREHNHELDKIARFVMAMYELNVARIWHDKDGYYVSLLRRLKVRKDDQGSFQEAIRLMEIV